MYTGKKAGAGTDANVIVTITGEKGELGPHKLDKKGDNFENGQYVLYSGFYHNLNKENSLFDHGRVFNWSTAYCLII